MGRVRTSRRKTCAKKEYKKAFKTDNRARDVDQIQGDLLLEKEKGSKMAFEVDDDLPGLGQFYCTPCGRHFFDEASLTTHASSRGHVRRMKDVQQKRYTRDESEMGAGKSVEILPSVNALRGAAMES
eukprot:CAMPEP_0119041556 /NCGR_PEP_ID=MMETSP1177-20130426/12549_1 /TAXON_ID=2985 /ORGANISM="Ochromonas sp, Strain CCMP1899" /LENGTH=126 /DNA_ID=CAMNT_0007007701 /DNA_START=52 /DNA_END=429 /DNA_ORIENTATION=+